MLILYSCSGVRFVSSWTSGLPWRCTGDQIIHSGNALGGFFLFGVHRVRSHMPILFAASLPEAWLLKLVVLVVLAAKLNGCVSMAVSERIATREEPQGSKCICLTANEKYYTISRLWDDDFESISIKRSDLPAGCESTRFFLNDLSHELRIMEPVSIPWLTWEAPPLPDERYPPCALLVSYGSFSEPSKLEGVVVTSSTGVFAKGERPRSHPAVWALTPAAMMVEGYAMVGAFWTSPIWVPIALMSGQNKEKERSVLPQPVNACWVAVDDKVKNGWLYDLRIKVTGFNWSSKIESAYLFTTANELFSDDNQIPIDSRITLRKGSIFFCLIETDENLECNLQSGSVDFHSIGTDADIECGLQSNNVVAIKIKLLR